MPTTWNKPAGLPVFPPHDDPHGDCVLTKLLTAEPARGCQPWPEGFAGGIAHRIDISTSGALWVADDPAELAAMRAHFAQRRLRKTYRLRAARGVSWTDHVCDLPIAHDRRRRRRMIVQRGRNTPHRGRWYDAHTEFTQLRGDLWQVVITTGVMHQIRVHAAFVGLPLLGDRLYGGGAPPQTAPEGVQFFLHHEGLVGPGDWSTTPVPLPDWAR